MFISWLESAKEKDKRGPTIPFKGTPPITRRPPRSPHYFNNTKLETKFFIYELLGDI
jgi:hypothetical protein